MKRILFLCCLTLAGLQANSLAQPLFSIKERDKPLPAALKYEVRGEVLRSATAPVGPRGASCWLVWSRPHAKTFVPAVFAVWMPTGKQEWREIGAWTIGNLTSDWNEINVEWLNAKRREGLVLIAPGETTSVLALLPPEKGHPNPQRSKVVSDEFTDSATSIYATNYRIGDYDERGFFGITKVYSEPGMDKDGNTITVAEETALRWNGNGWSAAAK